MEEYICDGCNEKFSISSSKIPSICPFCQKNYIRKEKDPLKRIAIINGSVRSRLKVVIHPDGDIQIIDFLGEKIVNPDFDIESEEEINEKEYNKLIRNN